MRTILAIAWKDVFITFTDRNLVLLMVATPFILSTIIGVAFSRLGSEDVPVEDIPVAVLNLDQGDETGLNFGAIIASALVPGADAGLPPVDLAACGIGGDLPGQGTGDESNNPLFDLTEAVSFDAALAGTLIDSGDIERPVGEEGSHEFLEAAVRSAVEAEVYTAAIIIPADFTQTVSFQQGFQPDSGQGETSLLVFADASRPVSANIIHSIATGITNRIVAGNINLEAALGELVSGDSSGSLGTGLSPSDVASLAGCAFVLEKPTVLLAEETLEGTSSNEVTQAVFVRFGSAQAMFFGLFTAGFGVLSMYDERKNWTLQRLLISPTPRSAILSGKLIGVYLTVLFQLSLLLVALTIVASIVIGEPTSIWGGDLVKTIAVTLAAAFSVTGFGMLLSGIARTPEQGQIFIPIFSIALAILGGSFGFVLPEGAARFSLIYWGRTAYESLSFGSGDVWLNVLVLAAMGALFFLIGLYLFTRRFEMTE